MLCSTFLALFLKVLPISKTFLEFHPFLFCFYESYCKMSSISPFYLISNYFLSFHFSPLNSFFILFSLFSFLFSTSLVSICLRQEYEITANIDVVKNGPYTSQCYNKVNRNIGMFLIYSLGIF